MASPDLSIVVPAYNEAAHIEGVIVAMANALGKEGIQYEILVVNNGSQDDTGAVIDKLHRENPRLIAVHLERNQQYGGGVLAGLRDARGTTLGWAHADGQADPHDIVRLYRKMQSEGTELGKATRVVSFESSLRKIVSAIYIRIFWLLFGSRYKDVNGTPKLLTQSALKKLSLESRDWFLDPEFVIKSIRYDMPITEIETVWHERKSGATRARLFVHGLQFLKNMLWYRFGLK